MSNQNVGYSRHIAYKAMCEAKKKVREKTVQEEQSINFSNFMAGGLLKYEGEDMLLKFKEELLKKHVEHFEEYAERVFYFMAKNIGLRQSMESIDVIETIHQLDAADPKEWVEAIAVLRDTAIYFVMNYFNERITLEGFMEKLEFIWWTYV